MGCQTQVRPFLGHFSLLSLYCETAILPISSLRCIYYNGLRYPPVCNIELYWRNPLFNIEIDEFAILAVISSAGDDCIVLLNIAETLSCLITSNDFFFKVVYAATEAFQSGAVLEKNLWGF